MTGRPLRVQIVIISVALFLVVLSALLVASRVTYREQVAGLRDEARAMTAVVVAYLERHLRATDDLAALAVRHPDVQRLEPAAALAVLRMLVDGEPSIRNAVLADAEGRVLGWATPPLPGLEDQLDAAWLSEVARAGERRVTPVLSEPRHAVHVVVMAYPMSGVDGRVAGVVGLAVHLEALEQVFSSIPLPEASVITVTDEQSVVVARSLDAARFVGRPVEASEATLRPLEDIPAVDLRTGPTASSVSTATPSSRGPVAGLGRHPDRGRPRPCGAHRPPQLRDHDRRHCRGAGPRAVLRPPLAGGARRGGPGGRPGGRRRPSPLPARDLGSSELSGCTSVSPA